MRNVTLDPSVCVWGGGGGGGGGGGYSTDAWVGRCGPGVQTLTLFKTQFSDFPIPLKQNSKFSGPFLDI